jgi:carbon-monoxide dehydrogenase small subunit
MTTHSRNEERIVVTATINGDERSWLSSSRDSLLEALRDRLALTGSKEGCNNGNCGACSVILDGRLVNSCLVMAAEGEGSTVTTIEGLAVGESLHPLQTAFLEQAALQCGICTPGFLMASKALLDSNTAPTEEQIRFWLAGNLCRCTGYDKIIRAVQQAADEVRTGVRHPGTLAEPARASGRDESNTAIEGE